MKNRKVVGYAIKKNRVVKVYKFSGLRGKRFMNKRKVTCKVYKTRRAAMSSKKRRVVSRRNRFGKTSEDQNFYDKSIFTNNLLSPANAVSYTFNQYATNIASPNDLQLQKISGIPAYTYPSSSKNLAWF